MHEERLAIVKKEIRSVIITYPKGVSLKEFLKTYHQLVGVRLPSRVFGFTSDVDFLYSLEDTVKVHIDNHGDITLTCIADDSTEHIQKLVLKQRNVKIKTRNASVRDQRPVSHSSKTKPFVSASLRKNLFEVLKDFPDGISYNSLLLAYQKKFKRPLNLEFLSESRYDRLRKLERAVSELQVKVIDETERLFYCPLLRKGGTRKQEDDNKEEEASSVQKLPQLNGHNLETVDIPIIPHVIRQDFEKALKLYPDGVLARHFPFLYEKVSGEMFELADLGFNNFLELADALPEVFICVKPYESPNEWMLFHTCFSENAEKLKKLNEALQLSDERFGRENETHIPAIPSDIVLPTHSYSHAEFPSDLNLSKYFPVFVSAAANPGCFWFKLIITEVTDRFTELENELQLFYHTEKGDTYQMSPADIKIGTTCVAMHDDHWYRATVTSHPYSEIVKVYLVDYGSWEKVQCSKLRYLRNSFISLPEQAFKAQLAAVKPINNSKVWNKTATRRFLQLCSKPYIMAQVHLEFEDTLSVYLCDTYGEDDIYVNDTLVDEELAEHCSTTDFNNTYPVSDADGPNFVEDLADDYYEDSQRVNGKGCGASSNRATLVERVYLGDGYWSHIIMISKVECYMTAADLCNLFWQDKSVEVLKSRLWCKNIEIPTTTILRDEQKDLFLKCEGSGVHGFSPLHQSVELHPLSAVMKVLNCLGHPSIKVREAIQTVLKDQNGIYDLLKKSTDYCDVNPMSSKDDMNKHCLYDLKAMLEAVKFKRVMLLKKYKEIPQNEIKNDLHKAEALMGIIENRIKDINLICMSYSNYE